MMSDAKRKLPIDAAESKTPCMRGNSMRENREISSAPPSDGDGGRLVKAHGQTTSTHAGEKSDGPIVPAKRANNAAPAAAESVEGRGPTKRNADQEASSRTPSRSDESDGLARVRQAARRDRRARMTALLHHVDVELLWQSFYALKREASPGIDGTTWRQYERELQARLADLHARVHRGSYRALPSRRVHIPKPDGGTRPLGIAALEDKIVQQALRKVLEGIYEEDFLGFSYGFRSGRGQHDALDALTVAIERKRINWVLDADIRGFFDAIDHQWLLKFLEHRIADRRVLRLIRKWLRAGVVEDGQRKKTTVGTPQGAVISPLLANVFLHYVFDLWVHHWRAHHARGDVIVVRYADDFVLGFQHQSDARRCLRAMRERLRKFGLELHPEKTRLLAFGRFAEGRNREQGLGPPEVFDFLGFTHYCGKSRSGRFLVKRKTNAKRMRRTLAALGEKLRRRRHQPLAAQGAWLRRVVQGWLNYHAVPHNSPRLLQFLRDVVRLWRLALRRRSDKSRPTWQYMRRLADRWLPRPRILHPYPQHRFDVRLKVGAV